MKALNSDVNTSRLIANDGCDFIEDTNAHTGIWYGFMPHNAGCKVAAVTIVDGEGNALTTTPSWVGTTADLDAFITPDIVVASGKPRKGYITSITLTSGACTLYKDTLKSMD